LRAFVRLRFTEASGTSGDPGERISRTDSVPATGDEPPPGASSAPGAPSDAASCEDCLTTDLDEAWLKWDIANAVFVTVGKQHVKWGSGRFWNPTDFTATTTRAPFSLFDRRLGTEMIKVHVPWEKYAHNYYAIVQQADAEHADQAAVALRAEVALFGRAELALSFYSRAHQTQSYGVDLSSALGPLDGYVEAAFSRHVSESVYSGRIDPATSELPSSRPRDSGDLVASVVLGLSHTFTYGDNDTLRVGGESFFNGRGYEDRALELYAMVNGARSPLYAGRRYAGAWAELPHPGALDHTSFFASGIKNLSDETATARLTMTYLLFNEATLELYAGRCWGDYGDLCFRVPNTYQALATSPTLSPAQRQLLATLPDKRATVTAGAGASLNF
jgi:hypothetical protein